MIMHFQGHIFRELSTQKDDNVKGNNNNCSSGEQTDLI